MLLEQVIVGFEFDAERRVFSGRASTIGNNDLSTHYNLTFSKDLKTIENGFYQDIMNDDVVRF